MRAIRTIVQPNRCYPTETVTKGSRLFFLLAFLAMQLASSAQSSRSPADSVIEEKLVELALQGPEAKRLEHQNNVYGYQLKAARNSWMNFLTLSANYNDQTFAQTGNTAYVYPKYFFGLNIPLGTIISGKQAKIARETVAIGELTQEELRRRLRMDVIGKYRQYKAQGELVAIETSFMSDLQAALVQAEEKFRNGTITFEAYNAALKNRNDEQAKIINLKLQQELTKLEIERMIGTSLESVVK
jgi:outer membrane protein TolC